ncbi:transparent testa 12 [Prunus yedoensis var. nudiflora]|uniref:Transparent testa 12 n=1 Tax=Prunus yedoensis var. nudiflora TaxID=2094558 RepID=A0A314XZQ3_PRUYE|nr:transparent testa 12 [Prunus yedoensis var. nudiflora]
MVCMIVVLITKDYFSVIFTSKELQQAAAKLAYFFMELPWFLIVSNPDFGYRSSYFASPQFPLCMQVLLLEVDGKYWWLISAWVVGYYIFGLPLGFLLGYKANLRVKGIWGGMICGTALQTLLHLIALHRTLWNN